MSDKCRNCVHFDSSNRDAVNSSKCHCDERDIYVYPDEEICGDFDKK